MLEFGGLFDHETRIAEHSPIVKKKIHEIIFLILDGFTMQTMNFGKFLEYCRESKTPKMSAAALAARINVHPSYIRNLEKGREKPPTLERCREISLALSLSPAETTRLIDLAMTERVKPEALEWFGTNVQKTRQIPVFTVESLKNWDTGSSLIPDAKPKDFRTTTAKGEDMFGVTLAGEDETFIINPGISPRPGDLVLTRHRDKTAIEKFQKTATGEILGVVIEINKKLR